MKKLLIFTLLLTNFSVADICDYIYFNDELNKTLLSINAVLFLAIIIALWSKKIHKERHIDKMFH